MKSLVDKLNPRNFNWEKSQHKVTPEISRQNDAKISELEKEQKLLESKLKRGVYKSNADFNRAWDAQNRSMQRMIDYRDRWDEIKSTHPIVNKQREKEKDRFMGKAIAIQKKYENVVAQQKGVCGSLSEKTCSKGKDCYWFGSENVRGKDAGCYSKKEPRKNYKIGHLSKPTKRSKKPTLSAIQENPLAARQYKQKRNEETNKTRTETTRSSLKSYPDRFEGGKTKRRERKKTRRKRKRRTKRRTNRRTKRRTKRRKR